MYRRHPATRVPSRNRRRRAHPLPRRRHPTPRGVVEDGEVIHRQGLGSESITAWIGHVEEHYGWEERERVEQPAGEALVETIVAGLNS